MAGLGLTRLSEDAPHFIRDERPSGRSSWQAQLVRRRSKPASETIGPIRLYLDDVEAIAEILGAGGRAVSIMTEQHELESVESLEVYRGTTLHELSMRIDQPHVSVEVRRNGGWIYVAADDELSMGVFMKARDVFLRRRLPFHWLVTANWRAFVVLLVLINIAGVMLRREGIGPYVALAIFVVSIVWLFVAYDFDMRRGGTVVPVRRGEAPSFLRRNADRILVGLIVGSITAVLALLLTKI